MTSRVISVVARDMSGVSAEVVRRKLILLVQYLNYLLIVVLLRVVVIVEREDPTLAPWFKRVGLPPVAGVSFQIEDGVLKRLHAESEFATVQTTHAVPESLRQLMLSYAHESD
ncbi:hypothetical protein PoB_004397200 [Plakobranchus ocellatus]|uniref:Uncharacterized protein n=1 Tax=Plakobranchus ocellatus TaxID=259542 RepID=A0AAV4BDE9_9GAST|nr:hypothetical protein PoB_004397200 [Plakobranchus ocellatus]